MKHRLASILGMALGDTNADTPERIRIDDLKQNAIVLASVIHHAAMRTEPIPSSVRK